MLRKMVWRPLFPYYGDLFSLRIQSAKCARARLIEYEIHRADPSNNIAKISFWLHKEKPEQKITVIQVFTPHYISTSGKKKAKAVLAEYLGRELIEKQYDKRYRPIYSKSLNHSDFEELYKSFSCTKTGDEKAEGILKLFTQEIISQIERIIM